MKKPTLLFFSTLLLSNLLVPLVAATEHTNQAVVSELQNNALKSDLAYKIAESLTVEVGPRLAGSAENALAVDWAEAKLKSLGFDKVYREPVVVPVWQRGEASASVVAPFPQKLVISALGGSVATPPAGLQAKVVRFDTLAALTAADAAQVKDKIVFIDQKTERHQDGSGYGKSVGGRVNGAVAAARKGAVAVLIRSIGTDHDRMAHTGLMHYQEDVPRIPAAALTNPDANQLDAMLRRGQEVTLSLNMSPKSLGNTTTYNVIGEFTGSSKPDEIVLLGAHLDSWDEGTGAIDDAAGVAIVTAAAKMIGDLPQRPARTIRVVLFAAEEIGLLGGKAYVAQHANEMAKHYIAAESDFGAGRIYHADVRVNETALSPVWQRLSGLAALNVAQGNNGARGGSEVSLLPTEGVPVASLRQDGSDYFDYHHTPNDTLDKIDPAALAQNVAVYATFAYQMAQSTLQLRPLPQAQ